MLQARPILPKTWRHRRRGKGTLLVMQKLTDMGMGRPPRLCFCFLGWGETASSGHAGHCQPRMECGAVGGVRICPPQILHTLTWARTLEAA
jgi:hypothetical protein